MKKRTLFAVLLVIPMGAVFAQQGEAMSDASAIGKEQFVGQSKWGTTSGTVTDGIKARINQQSALTGTMGETYNRPSSNEAYSGISNDSMLGRLINWLQQYFVTQGQVRTYQGQPVTLTGTQGANYNVPSGNETYSGVSNDSTLTQIAKWLQQQFLGTPSQVKTYQGQTTLTGAHGEMYNRPSSSNQTDSALSNDSTLAQIATWLQQQFLGTQSEPSQPKVVNKPAQ